MAKQNTQLTSISQLEIAEAEENIEEIFGTLLSPQFKVVSYGGIISDAEGDITTTVNTNEDNNNFGPFFKTDLTVIQPIYSFGKYDAAMEAGRKNLEMKKAALRETINSLSFEVTKSFLGVVAGHEGSNLGQELSEGYQQVLIQIQKLLQDSDSGIDSSHLLEAQAMFFEIEKQSLKPIINEEQALFYLRGLLNQKQDAKIITNATATPELDPASDLLPQLLELSRTHSPLIQRLDSGLQALSKKAELEQKKSYPDLFLAIRAGYGIAPDRDEQTNAFVTDSYNYKDIGGALGLKWDFNFHKNNAKERKALIEYQKIMQKKDLTLIQMDGKIRKFHSEALKHQKLLHAAVTSLKAAKTWRRLENSNLDLGIGDVKRLIKANQSYYQLKGDEVETRYRYLVSLAQLAEMAGNMDLFLQWLENGKVQLL